MGGIPLGVVGVTPDPTVPNRSNPTAPTYFPPGAAGAGAAAGCVGSALASAGAGAAVAPSTAFLRISWKACLLGGWVGG